MPYAIFAMAIAFMSIAFWLIFEVNISVLRYFKKWRGLYFWSLLVSSWGTFFHTLGYVTQWWAPNSSWIMNTCFILFGWSAMITGQSLVLYSRLHLVILNREILRYVLILIIGTAIFIQIPQWVATWGACDTKLSITKYWSPIDSIMVRISQAVFLLQEGLLSGLYIWGAMQMLAPNVEIKVKKVMWELIAVSTYLVLVDVAILILAYLNEHIPKEPVQNFAYAFKLKLEFIILNQLLAVLQRNRHGSDGPSSDRYTKGSRKKSGDLIQNSFGSSEKDRNGSNALSPVIPPPPASGGPWRSLSSESSGGSPNAAVPGPKSPRSPKSQEPMRQNSKPNIHQPANSENMAWVTREVDVKRSPHTDYFGGPQRGRSVGEGARSPSTLKDTY